MAPSDILLNVFSFLDAYDLHEAQTICHPWLNTINGYAYILPKKLIKKVVIFDYTREEDLLFPENAIRFREFLDLWTPEYIVEEFHLRPSSYEQHYLRDMIKRRGQQGECVYAKKLKIIDTVSCLVPFADLLKAHSIEYKGCSEFYSQERIFDDISCKTLSARFEKPLNWRTERYVDFISSALPKVDFKLAEFPGLMPNNYDLVPMVYQKFMDLNGPRKFVGMSIFGFHHDVACAAFIIKRIIDFMKEGHEIHVIEQRGYAHNVFMVKKEEWYLMVEAHFDHGICIQVKKEEKPTFELIWNVK